MRVGVLILPATRWVQAADQWRLVEELGFSHAWTFDHLTWRDLADRTWFSALPTLTAAAAVTTRISLGTVVSTPNFRHPVALAKEAMTLDDISQGRFILGLGSGVGGGGDATVLNRNPLSPGQRAQRFEEFVELTDRLLSHPVCDYAGDYYHADHIHMRPGCLRSPRLPLAVAGTGVRGMRLAVEHGDIWVTNGTADRSGATPPVATPATVAAQVERLEAICMAAGRDPGSLHRMLVLANRNDPLESAAAFAETAERYARAGITDIVVPFPRDEPPFTADIRILHRIAADVLPRLST